jgi:hypothetical protein
MPANPSLDKICFIAEQEEAPLGLSLLVGPATFLFGRGHVRLDWT